MIRVVLPLHLQRLANVGREVTLDATGPMTIGAVMDALEATYPMLTGTVRDRATGERRPFVRIFACEEDVSLESPDYPLPDPVRNGEQPLFIIGAMAGG